MLQEMLQGNFKGYARGLQGIRTGASGDTHGVCALTIAPCHSYRAVVHHHTTALDQR